jgi:hypothetical protein
MSFSVAKRSGQHVRLDTTVSPPTWLGYASPLKIRALITPNGAVREEKKRIFGPALDKGGATHARPAAEDVFK